MGIRSNGRRQNSPSPWKLTGYAQAVTNPSTPEFTGTLAMGGASGKVALVTGTTALTGACPTGVLDMLGYGATANCGVGAQVMPNLTITTAAQRRSHGCALGNAATDWLIGTPQPHNGATVVGANGTGVNEVPFCKLHFPTVNLTSIGVPTSNIFGRLQAGLSGTIIGQLGFGPLGTDPMLWTFADTTVNTGCNSSNGCSTDVEYQGSITPVSNGAYGYAYRFSTHNGAHYTWCDLDGAGTNAGLSWDQNQIGVLMVAPP